MPDANPNRDDKGRFAPKFGALFTVGVIGLGVALGVGGEAGGTGAGGGAVADTPSLSVQARAARGSRRAGRIQRLLVGRGLRAEIRAQRSSSSCADDARGQVREFLTTHPCESVYRTSFVVRRDDLAAVVAVAWIDMAQTNDAIALKTLIDEPGTGGIDELPLPRSERPVEVLEPAYASRRRDRLVIIVEAQPLAVTPGQRVLEDLAEQTAENAADS